MFRFHRSDEGTKIKSKQSSSKRSADKVSWISAISVSAIILLSFVAAVTKKFQFFPTPKKESWQHRTFITLFRLFVYPLIGLSIFFSEPVLSAHLTLQYGIAVAFIAIGFGLTF